MAKIIMTLIDNRLLHGQVAIQWCGSLNVKRVIVANDQLVQDDMRQNLMRISMPSYASVDFKTIESMKDILIEEDTFLVCETVFDVLTLVNQGLEISKISVGNMHMSENKRQIGTYVAIDDEDVNAFKKLKEKGIDIQIRRLPDLASEDNFKLFN